MVYPPTPSIMYQEVKLVLWNVMLTSSVVCVWVDIDIVELFPEV